MSDRCIISNERNPTIKQVTCLFSDIPEPPLNSSIAPYKG